jgi:hypothetical protein
LLESRRFFDQSLQRIASESSAAAAAAAAAAAVTDAVLLLQRPPSPVLKSKSDAAVDAMSPQKRSDSLAHSSTSASAAAAAAAADSAADSGAASPAAASDSEPCVVVRLRPQQQRNVSPTHSFSSPANSG